jgi:hypothetical protein
LVGQADRRTDEQIVAELRDRHERLKRDQRTVHELNDIFEERWMISRSDTRLDDTRAKRRYPQLFHSYGLAVGREPAADIAAKIRESVVAEAIASGMTEWFFVDPNYPGLTTVVDVLDPDPGRAALRAAIVANDDDRVDELVQALHGSLLPPAFAAGLTNHLLYIHPATERHLWASLRATWAAHPDSFPLTLTICAGLSHAPFSEEKTLSWARAAVALRPRNPLAHYYLAVASFDATAWFNRNDARHQDTTYAVRELRQTIKLAPRFARAYALLAFLLSFDGSRWKSNADSLEVARKAIHLDSEDRLALLVVFMHLAQDEKQFTEAGEIYRRMSKLAGAVGTGIQQDWPFYVNALGTALPQVTSSFMEQRKPFHAYRFFVLAENTFFCWMPVGPYSHLSDGAFDYNAARAAALAGTAQGVDAPPPPERAGIRKQALKWLDERAVSPAKFLKDPAFAAVRDDKSLAILPPDERQQWRRLWARVRSLRDGKAPPASRR